MVRPLFVGGIAAAFAVVFAAFGGGSVDVVISEVGVKMLISRLASGRFLLETFGDIAFSIAAIKLFAKKNYRN